MRSQNIKVSSLLGAAKFYDVKKIENKSTLEIKDDPEADGLWHPYGTGLQRSQRGHPVHLPSPGLLCTVLQRPQRRNLLKHCKCSVTKSSFFLSQLALREHNTLYPKFLAACAKMSLCEGRRLPHSHCSSSPSASGVQPFLPPTQETKGNPNSDPRAGGRIK